MSQTTPADARTGTASWPRRILALFVDWTACNLVLVAVMLRNVQPASREEAPQEHREYAFAESSAD